MEQSNFKKFLSEWILSPRVVFLILGTILILEVIIGVKTLLSPVETSPPLSQPTTSPQKVTTGASINLSLDQQSYEAGAEVLVSVNVSTGDYLTDGTDVVLQFDPQVLEPTKDFFMKGSIYQDYPGARKDLAKGIVSTSGIAVSDPFKGSGVFGTFKFKAKKRGVSLIELKFSPSSTTDSNIIESKSAKDILEEGSKVEIKIE